MSDTISPEEMSRRVNGMAGCSSIAAARQASPPETAAQKHGAYADGIKRCSEGCPLHLAGRCDECSPGAPCPRELARLEELLPIYTRHVKNDGVLPMDVAIPYINDAIIARLRYERILAWDAVMDEVTALDVAIGEFEIQPGTKAVGKFRAEWRAAMEDLLLTGPSRLALEAEQQKSQASGWGAMARQVGPGAGRPGGEAVDVEFEAEDGDGGRNDNGGGKWQVASDDDGDGDGGDPRPTGGTGDNDVMEGET